MRRVSLPDALYLIKRHKPSHKDALYNLGIGERQLLYMLNRSWIKWLNTHYDITLSGEKALDKLS